MLTRLEERGRLSALGSLIKGLQGREQATRVKITHTLHRAAGIREPEEREEEEEIDGEDEEEEEGEGWSRELEGREGWRATGRAERAGCSRKTVFFFLFASFVRPHESMSFTERQRERESITVIALRQRITLSHHSQNLAKTARGREASL